VICEYCNGDDENCLQCDGTGVAICCECGGPADTDYEGYVCGPCLGDILEEEMIE
jgi:hypothetical protein